MASGTVSTRSRESGEWRCPLCREPLGDLRQEPLDDVRLTTCSGCETRYHSACVAELGGCSTLGCPRRPASRAPGTTFAPVADDVAERQVELAARRRAAPVAWPGWVEGAVRILGESLGGRHSLDAYHRAVVDPGGAAREAEQARVAGDFMTGRDRGGCALLVLGVVGLVLVGASLQESAATPLLVQLRDHLFVAAWGSGAALLGLAFLLDAPRLGRWAWRIGCFGSSLGLAALALGGGAGLSGRPWLVIPVLVLAVMGCLWRRPADEPEPPGIVPP